MINVRARVRHGQSSQEARRPRAMGQEEALVEAVDAPGFFADNWLSFCLFVFGLGVAEKNSRRIARLEAALLGRHPDAEAAP